MVVENGLVERRGEFEGGGHGGEAGDVELGAQGVNAVVERGSAGVADQGGDGRVDRGGAQVEAGEELVGEVDFVVGLAGVAEGDGEGAQGLAVCGFVGFGVSFVDTHEFTLKSHGVGNCMTVDSHGVVQRKDGTEERS
ncbi:hypothetical protein ACFYZB_34600 [Streptomyces sp. NPDC001852]|uniref:hypothetical protein n=1 Tax=Streptomyces sp. NPDC001852 TaxID=3364619 RepID=UPI0036A3CC64